MQTRDGTARTHNSDGRTSRCAPSTDAQNTTTCWARNKESGRRKSKTVNAFEDTSKNMLRRKKIKNQKMSRPREPSVGIVSITACKQVVSTMTLAVAFSAARSPRTCSRASGFCSARCRTTYLRRRACINPSSLEKCCKMNIILS